MGISKKDITADFQDAVRDGYQDFLMELGFVSYKDDLLHWYLLRNEVLFSLQMLTMFISSPFMYPVFAAKPLFVKTMIPVPLVSDELYSIDNFRLCDKEWKVFCRREAIHYPRGEHFGGILVKEQIESYLSVIQTPKDAFEQRKARLREHEQVYLREDFVDEVIYYRDEEMWERALRDRKSYFSDITSPANVQKDPAAARQLAQLHALEDPVARLEHVAKLNEKKKTQLAELRRKVPAAFQNEPVFRNPNAL